MKYQSDFVYRVEFIDSIDIETYKKILNEVGIGENYKTTDYKDVKKVNDIIYRKCEQKIIALLKKWNSYQLIIEAMTQLEFWTHYFNGGNIGITVTEEQFNRVTSFSRYSWQYIIEIVITKFIMNKDKMIRDLTYKELHVMFTLSVIMGYSSNISNELHYYGENFTDIEYNYSRILSLKFIKIRGEYRELYLKEAKYSFETPDLEKFNNFAPSVDNNKIIKLVDVFLQMNYGFNYNNVNKIINAIINIHKKPVMIVDSFDYFIETLNIETGLEQSIITKCLNFISFKHINNLSERDFLRKSETYRMINFSSVIIPKTKKLKSLFGDTSSKRIDIIKAKKYIIISPLITIDWENRFLYRLLHNKVEYLNTDKKIEKELKKIEQYFHKNIFENEFEIEMKKRDYYTIKSLDTIMNKRIECGEIDLIAISPNLKRVRHTNLK